MMGKIDYTRYGKQTAVSPLSQPVKADGSERSDNGRLRANTRTTSVDKSTSVDDPIRQRIEQLGRAVHAQANSEQELAHDERQIREALGAVWQTVKAYRAEGMPDTELMTQLQQRVGLEQVIERLPIESPFQDTVQMTQLVQRVFEPIQAKSQPELDAPLVSRLRRVEE